MVAFCKSPRLMAPMDRGICCRKSTVCPHSGPDSLHSSWVRGEVLHSQFSVIDQRIKRQRARNQGEDMKSFLFLVLR